MAFTPDTKNPGDLIKSADWNDAMTEIVRLEGDKVDRAGDVVAGDLRVNGKVGVGVAPNSALHLAGGQWNPSASEGDLKIGNDTVRLKVGVATGGGGAGDVRIRADGGTNRLLLGSGTEDVLTIQNGRVGIGVSAPTAGLQVAGGVKVAGGLLVDDLKVGTAALGLQQIVLASGTNAGDVHLRANGGSNKLMLGSGTKDQVTIDGSAVELHDDLKVPNSTGGTALLSGTRYNNQSASLPTVNLSLGHLDLINPGALSYRLAIGNTFNTLGGGGGGGVIGILKTNFNEVLGVSQLGVNIKGNLSVSGGKNGYVVDHFVNRVGEALEEGDVVVISKRGRVRSCGDRDLIPIPEVDPASEAYDTRVCGIVAAVVTEEELPFVETEAVEVPADVDVEKLRAAKGADAKAPRHPMADLAASGEADRGRVKKGQMGRMVTLGCFGRCKVDADIAAIEAGDLLTTSPTKGHAQKVEDRAKAVGAIVGKALAPLAKGKGTIPVLVLMQ